MGKAQKFAKRLWSKIKDRSEDFKRWSSYKEHPGSKLDKGTFLFDLLKFTVIALVFLIIDSNLDELNAINLDFIKLGSLILAALSIWGLIKVWHLGKNLKYAVRGSNNGAKSLFWLVLIFGLLFVLLNQQVMISSTEDSLNQTNFSKFNPIDVRGNYSLFSIGSKDYKRISINKLSKNPKKYVERNISISGNLVKRSSAFFTVSGYTLEGNDGYWVWISDNCLEPQREYEKGDLHNYEAKGSWAPPKEKENSFEIEHGLEYKYRLSCHKPLN